MSLVPDVEIEWQVPTSGLQGHGGSWPRGSNKLTLGDGECTPDGRHCVRDGLITIQFLHPSDSGRFICNAKSKFGQDQRVAELKVKVRPSTSFSKIFSCLRFKLLYYLSRYETQTG